MSRLCITLAVAGALAFPLSGWAEEPAIPPAGIVQGPLGTKVDEYMKRLADFGFSGALLVAKDDAIVLAQGYGLADREKNLPVSANTVFSIGSITKQFTAAAILKLEMQGKLKSTTPSTST